MSGAVRAQGGMLDSQTQYEIITGPGQNNQHGQLLAIVLWHGPPDWNVAHTATARARSDSIYRWVRFHAEETGQSFFGSGLWYGLLDQDQKAVTIEGTRIPLIRTDSARIIMVTVTPDNLPRIVTTTWLPARLPNEFWPKIWHSGDTTFFVQPGFPHQQVMLREALARSPTVAEFLR
jgi:arylamine N-acetyltransferase